MAEQGGIAVVGMSCAFPGAPSLRAFWRNVVLGIDAITDMPDPGWDRAFHGPERSDINRIGCRRGGFIQHSARFDPLRHGVMPAAARGSEPDQLLALALAARALRDAGYERRPPRRTGVILGRGCVVGPGQTELTQSIRGGEQLAVALEGLLPGIDAATLERLKREFRAKIGEHATKDLIGKIPNLIASRISGRYDFAGPAYTLDAACASSLLAVDHGCLELLAGRVDMMICGGAHLCRDEAYWSLFNQLGALSPSQRIRPFDARADGLLIGEGIGMLVLKRAADAQRAGDRIYAVIRGSGGSSDGRGGGAVSPSSDGQVRALEHAWLQTDRDPTDLGLLEAHGTGTPAGDAAEVETLRRFFGRRGVDRRAALGSVKSMIGHTMAAAGAAGLIKTVLSLYHEVLPPSLHCEQPRDGLEDTAFAVRSTAASWNSRVRLAGVNAFGFGGVNAHVVLEGEPRARPLRAACADRPLWPAIPELACYAARGADELARLVEHDRRGGEGGCRLALLDPTPERRERALQVVARGKPVSGQLGIFFAAEPLLAGNAKVALLFPGFDAAFNPRAEGLSELIGVEPPELTIGSDIESVGRAILRFNALMHDALTRVGVLSDMMAGHSLGDLSALIAGGMVDGSTTAQMVDGLRPGVVEVANVSYLAAGCDRSVAEQVIAEIGEAALSHDNCPHQVVLCVPDGAIEAAVAAFGRRGVVVEALPFKLGMHTRYFAPQVPFHRRWIDAVTFSPPRLPIYCAADCEPYSADADATRRVAVQMLTSTVRFRELVERMYADGARVFIQAGAGSLAMFVDDTLEGRPHLSLGAAGAGREPIEQLLRVMCGYWVAGGEPDFADLPLDGPWPRRRGEIELRLSVPLVRFEQPLAIAASSASPGNARPSDMAASAAESSMVAQTFAATMAQLAAAQSEVLEAARATHEALPVARSSSVVTKEVEIVRSVGVEQVPEFEDHSFYPQPEGSDIAERFPVMPMTAMLLLMQEAAEAAAPGSVAIELRDAEAKQWLPVHEPVDVRITAKPVGRDRIQVRVGDHALATVLVAERYPEPPAARLAPLENPRPAGTEGGTLYRDRWMFHGPAYQGVRALGTLGDDGLDGRIRNMPGPGALLDCGLQVLGTWLMLTATEDKMTFPQAIESVRLYGPHPALGEELDACSRVRRVDATHLVGDVTLLLHGRVWAVVENVVGRRVPADARMWDVMRWPEFEALSEIAAPGLARYRDCYRDALSRQYLTTRYLNRVERGQQDRLRPVERRPWLGRRIAARDAVRSLAWAGGKTPIFPVQIELRPRSERLFAAIWRGQGANLEALVELSEHDGATIARAYPAS